MRALAEMYVQQFKTTLASMFQYRASLLIWMIGQVLEPLVYLIVWSKYRRAAAEASVAIPPATSLPISLYLWWSIRSPIPG